MYIPAGVQTIARGITRECDALKTIVVDEANKRYDSRDSCNAIIEKYNTTIVAGCSTTLIPKSVKMISHGAITYCATLNSIAIPSSVSLMYSGAFFHCENLRTVIDLATTPQGNSGEVFPGASGLTIYVREPAVQAYKTTPMWSSLNIKPIVRGDAADANEYVSVHDYNRILDISNGKVGVPSRNALVFYTTDVTEDDMINKDDVAAVVDIINTMHWQVPGLGENSSTTNNRLRVDSLRVKAGTTVDLPIALDNKTVASSLQLDVALPAGMAYLSGSLMPNAERVDSTVFDIR